ncbi:hypothetical protein [uncultured Campylobacter sp.]|nr:hypothetical protein [uncultured Campylobacter sp.]
MLLNFKISMQAVLKFKISKDPPLSVSRGDEILMPRLTAKF